MRILKTVAMLAAGVLVWPGAVASAQTPCADLAGTLDGTTCKVHVTNPTYTIDATFPVDYADQQTLTDYLTQTRDGFVNVARMPGSTSLPYQLAIDSERYQTGQPPHGTQSVVLKIFQDVGGAQPSTWYKAFDYNLDTRKPITYDSLFLPGTKPLDVIYPIVKREFDRQSGPSGASVSSGDGTDPTHYQNFAITDTDLIFYFSQGELQPSTAGGRYPQSAGATAVHVPRDAVASMLAPLTPPP
ncbi:MAG: DUF3298 domain-containing protein [Mycobacteriaceae bacterium]|nr:DUF3298 domain-containing protein [Mycobacteriaceae bacterium]